MIEPETERQTDRYRETGYNEKLSDKFWKLGIYQERFT